MKAITTLFLILLTAGVGSSVYAHPSAVPLVELKVSLTDDALTYAARIPTFAIEPLHGYSLSEGESLESLPTSSDERARSLAESVGLGDKLHRYPGELSQGEKQRLAICRALITDPCIIMADEPTGNLDAGNTDAIMELIRNQARRRDATFVMITHEHNLLDRFDHVIELAKDGGRDTV